MPSNKHFLDHLRSKPESHKNILAAVFAIMPALFVGYAQFYMNSNSSDTQVDPSALSESVGIEEVSAIASMGKIFSESKATIGEALDGLKKIDDKMLVDTNNLSAVEDVNSTNTASGTISVTSDTNITKTTE